MISFDILAVIRATLDFPLAEEPELFERLRSSVRPPRTMTDVVAEMVACYLRLMGKSHPIAVSGLSSQLACAPAW
jgi:hypothetical protein